MAGARRLTDTFLAGPQIGPDEVAGLAAAGVALIINNRPDGEAPDQPSGAEIAAAARAAGVDYAGIPVRGLPGPDQVEAMAGALARATGPVLAYCRSGARSTACWAMAEVGAGALTPDEARARAAAAGFDLTGVPL